jgi:hypothetical protein
MGPLYTADRNLEEGSLAVPQKLKHRITIQLSNSSSRYMPKRNEHIGLPKMCTPSYTGGRDRSITD